MMKTMTTYKHDLNTDVAMFVIASKPVTNEQTRYRVRWMNIVNPKNVFSCTDKYDYVDVKHEDEKNWREYENQ